MHKTESLYCVVQIDTLSHINYPSINKKYFEKSIKNWKLLLVKELLKRWEKGGHDKRWGLLGRATESGQH